MLNNSKKVRIAIFLNAMLIVCQFLFATTRPGYVLKPNLPPLFKSAQQASDLLRNSSLPILFDYLTGLTRIVNLYYTAGIPATMVINATAAQKSANRHGTRLTALTANMLLFPPPFFSDQKEKTDEFVKLARSLNPDIIFLQEVWGNSSLAYLISQFSDYHAVLMPSPLFNLSGLLILSRFKPERVTAETYPLTMQHNIEELIARKGFLGAEISFAGQTLWLVNTHLYSAPPGARYRYAFSQFGQMQNRINGFPGAVIAGGDMNLMPQELEPLLAGGLMRDDCNLPTAGSQRRVKKLDYILAKGFGDSTVEVLGSRTEWPVFFSDHSPVFAEIRLNSPH